MHKSAELRRAGGGTSNRKKLTARLVWYEHYHEKEFSILAAIEKGRKLPQWAEEEPYLEPSEVWLMDAYSDLCTCRGVDGMIPWRDMVEYADRAELDADVNRAFVQIMRSIDTERMNRHRSKERSSDAEGTSTPMDDSGEAIVGMTTASKEAMRASARLRAGVAKGKK